MYRCDRYDLSEELYIRDQHDLLEDLISMI